MGGVDLADMLISLYKIPFKSRRWYIGIFCQLLDICINNAWILYSIENKGKNKSLKVFRYEIYQNLTKKNRFVNVEGTKIQMKNSKTARPTTPVRLDNVGHFPSMKEDMGRCKLCQKNTTVFCIKCNLRLCFVTGKNARNCFLNFHNKKIILMYKVFNFVHYSKHHKIVVFLYVFGNVYCDEHGFPEKLKESDFFFHFCRALYYPRTTDI